LIRAARYAQVAAWDLAKKPAIWMNWYLSAQAAEEFAAKEVNK
jgi:hypothetical protein